MGGRACGVPIIAVHNEKTSTRVRIVNLGMELSPWAKRRGGDSNPLDATATSRARTRENPWRTRAFLLAVTLDDEVRKRPFVAPSGRETCTEGAQPIGRVQHRDLESLDAPRPAIAYLADAPTSPPQPPADAPQPFASPAARRGLATRAPTATPARTRTRAAPVPSSPGCSLGARCYRQKRPWQRVAAQRLHSVTGVLRRPPLSRCALGGGGKPDAERSTRSCPVQSLDCTSCMGSWDSACSQPPWRPRGRANDPTAPSRGYLRRRLLRRLPPCLACRPSGGRSHATRDRGRATCAPEASSRDGSVQPGHNRGRIQREDKRPLRIVPPRNCPPEGRTEETLRALPASPRCVPHRRWRCF